MAHKPTYEQLSEELRRLEKEARQWRATEKALRESNDIVSSILATCATGIGLIENRTIRRVNTAMLKLFHYEKEADIVGESVRIFYPSREEFDQKGALIYDILHRGETAQIDTELRRKDGSTFLGHLKVSTRDPAHPMRMAIVTVTDISWRKQAEAQRLDKERLQGVIELAGAVCHELNQPIQIAVFEYAKVMAMEGIVAHPMTDTLKKIKAQLDRMRQITTKLMHITRYRTREYINGEQILDIDQAIDAENLLQEDD